MTDRKGLWAVLVGPGRWQVRIGATLIGVVQTNGALGWRAFPYQVGKGPSRRFWPTAADAARSMWGRQAAEAIRAAEAEAETAREGA